jgi:16S rRNA U1498 N3-methylase RsmE
MTHKNENEQHLPGDRPGAAGILHIRKIMRIKKGDDFSVFNL